MDVLTLPRRALFSVDLLRSHATFRQTGNRITSSATPSATPTCFRYVGNKQVKLKMAQSDGGYSNPALDTESEAIAETTLSNDELCLRVDKLEISEQTTTEGAAVINTDGMEEVPGVGGGDGEGNDMPLPNLTRDRPFSASMISRQTVASTRSHVSKSPSILTSDMSSKSLFSYRSDSLGKAFEDCSKSMLNPESDGEVKSCWLLTEVDHWNCERERIVLLTDIVVIIIKYDFIKMSAIEGKKIPLLCITKLQIGDLIFPSKSLMPLRDYGGVRIHYGDDNITPLGERWNPWSRAMPYVTLTHHMLAYNPQENETVTYNADELAESLVTALDQARKRAEIDTEILENQILDDTPITIGSYVGLPSIIFNHSRLGYYLERGGISF